LSPDLTEIQFETFDNPPAVDDSGIPIARDQNPIPATARKKRGPALHSKQDAAWKLWMAETRAERGGSSLGSSARSSAFLN
jgi:hypothetical protein